MSESPITATRCTPLRARQRPDADLFAADAGADARAVTEKLERCRGLRHERRWFARPGTTIAASREHESCCHQQPDDAG